MVAWPSSLPSLPLLRSYAESPPNLLLRTEMDQGPAKVRRRFTAGVRPFAFVLRMKSDQLDAFDTFFNDDLAGGALEFDFTSPRTGDTVSFRFTEPPEYKPRGGGIWDVSCKLEEMP